MKPTLLQDVSKERPPLTDISTLRKRARQHIEQDPTTRRMLVEILASEEEHADDLSSPLEGLKE
jgi:bacterioferritin (cytochrome b1)